MPIEPNLQAVLEEHYFLSKWNLNASDYGVPQARKRVFFVASKFGEIIPPKHQPQHTVRDADTVGEILLNIKTPSSPCNTRREEN